MKIALLIQNYWYGQGIVFKLNILPVKLIFGTYFPVNGTEFIAYIELPSQQDSFEYFEEYIDVKE